MPINEPPTTPPITFDFIGGAGNKKKKKKDRKGYVRKYRYTPSVEAIQLNIFGKQPKGKGVNELGFRPMLRL
jgi:hypothetical protein